MLRIVVPAREKSTRLPGKLLEPIAGKSVLRHVLERVLRAQAMLSVASDLVLATDSKALADAAPSGVDIVMTGAGLKTGTDRVAEVAARRGWSDEAGDVVVNVQADMPFIDPAQLVRFLRAAGDSGGWDMLTAYTLLRVVECYTAPFSRTGVFSHIGLYAYTPDALRRFAALPQSEGELQTSLEQVRAQQAGFQISFVALDTMPLEVNTPQDLATLRQLSRMMS